MLNRFHNYVVEQLAVVNENGRFHKPNEGLTHEMAEKSWAKYDNDLFQTGRLVTCGLYINITLLDYLRTIVNLNRTNSTWTLDPRAEVGFLPPRALCCSKFEFQDMSLGGIIPKTMVLCSVW